MARNIVVNKEANRQIAREEAGRFRLTVAALLAVIALLVGGYFWLKRARPAARPEKIRAVVTAEEISFREEDPKQSLDSPINPVLRTTRTARINKSPLALKREEELREALRAAAADVKSTPFAEEDASKEEPLTD